MAASVKYSHAEGMGSVWVWWWLWWGDKKMVVMLYKCVWWENNARKYTLMSIKNSVCAELGTAQGLAGPKQPVLGQGLNSGRPL